MPLSRFLLYAVSAMTLTILPLAVASAQQDAAADKPLAAYRDKNRVLLVFAPNDKDPAYLEQSKLMAKTRKRVLTTVSSWSCPVLADGKKAAADTPVAIEKKYVVDARTFAVVLLGQGRPRSLSGVETRQGGGAIRGDRRDAHAARGSEASHAAAPPPAKPRPGPRRVNAMGTANHLADIRLNYLRGQLRRADLLADPIEQFSRWMDEATAAAVVEPTAMSLATAGRGRRPPACARCCSRG